MVAMFTCTGGDNCLYLVFMSHWGQWLVVDVNVTSCWCANVRLNFMNTRVVSSCDSSALRSEQNRRVIVAFVGSAICLRPTVFTCRFSDRVFSHYYVICLGMGSRLM
jgi:hypothetical protein